MKPALCLAAVVAAMLCGCDTSQSQPGLDAADGGELGALDAADSGAAGSGSGQERLGAACARDNDCPDGMFCDEEITSTLVVPSAPEGEVVRSLFPGGSCSPRPIGPYDPDGGTSCDPQAQPGEQGCGDNGTCIVEGSDPELIVSCRVSCEPQASMSGCDRAGYTCDFELLACVEGCASDDDCRLLQVDTNGDGAPDALRYDNASAAYCDPKTARCRHEGGAVESGGPCATNDDCEEDGLCIPGDATLVGNAFPAGYCTKFGCEVDGRECRGDGSVCVPLRSLSGSSASKPACMTGCRVGAEPEAERVGSSGHGDGCRPGYRCQYNGGPGAAAGVCVGGNYNAVTENNVGNACQTDDECYSPYGIGLCLALDVGGVSGPSGTCSMLDCLAPGLPDDVCGADRTCLGLSGDVTFCARVCRGAEDCSGGFACADDDAEPSTPSICYPACVTDAECQPGWGCELMATGAGQCVALTSTE